jgi:hypothetical protein
MPYAPKDWHQQSQAKKEVVMALLDPITDFVPNALVGAGLLLAVP